MKKKKFLGVLLALCMIVGTLSVAAFAQENTVDTWDGTVDTSWYTAALDATEYHITTAEQLAGMAVLLDQDMYSFRDKTIYLETDVDLQNKPWTPIGNNFSDQSGNNYNRLSGAVFNGNGHIIYNLFIDASKLEHTGEANRGFFGFVENSSISNLGIENGVLLNEVGGYEDGLLAGKMNDCNVSDCYVTGKITEKGSINCIGGMIGQIYSGSSSKPVILERCYANVEIIAGENTNATIGALCTGSLWSRTQDLIIRDCYSNGTIQSNSNQANVAGLAALINWMPIYGQKNPEEASRGIIESCYSTVEITSSGYTADFAIIDGSVKNSCWIKSSDYGCLEGTDTCTQEDNCKAFSDGLAEDSLDILIAERESSPWVAFIAEKGPILSTEANKYPADYAAVDAAIAKAEALNKSNYKDFSAVETAVAAVVRGKNIAEQTAVDDYAAAIENAIAALTYKSADYSKVEEAIAKIPADLSLYTDATVKALNDAKNAVVRGKDITEQTAVDGYAAAIENAIAALTYKSADYSKVEEAIAKIPADLSLYTDATVKALNDAKNAVVRGKNITEQETVDAMAKAINDAVSALEAKPTPEPDDSDSPQTGDNSNIWLWLGLMLLSCGGVIGTTVYSKKRKAAR